MPIPDTLDSLTLRRDRIQQEFASLGDLRPGSLTRRLQQCGKPGCRCKAEVCQARLAEGDDGSDDEEKKTPSRRPSSPRLRPRSRRS